MDETPAAEWSFRTTDRDGALDAWADMLSSTHLAWSIRELEAESAGFGASVRRRHLADLILVDCTCDPCSGSRRLAEIADTEGEYLVMLMTIAGREVVSQGGVQSQLQAGSVVIWDSERPADFVVQDPLVKRSLFVPKAALAEVGRRGVLMTGSVLDQSAPAVRLLSGYLDGLSRTIDDLPLGALPAARNATIELLAAALQDVPVDAFGSTGSILAAAETYIERNLTDGDLCPATVADGVGVSLRTLHRAFETGSETVAGTIRTRRLLRARDDLLAGLKVGQVARRWRYADASHFSRAFKSYYGIAPSELTSATK